MKHGRTPEESALRRRLIEIESRYNNLPFDMQEIYDKLNALMAVVIVPTGERVRHEKRGTTYDVFGLGHANSSKEFHVEQLDAEGEREGGGELKKVLFDRDEVIIYRDVQSGEVSVRGTEEFRDGRFTQLRAPYGNPVRDLHAAVAEQVGGTAGTSARTTRKEPALSAPYGTPDKLPRIKFHQHGHPMHGKIGRVKEYTGEGNAHVAWEHENSITIVNSLNLIPIAEKED